MSEFVPNASDRADRSDVGRVLVSVEGVSKSFGSTAALAEVSLRGNAGSVHAITGENGAGKSTLMKILAGVHRPDRGRVLVDGRPVAFAGPAAARAAGISTVFQELTVLPNLSVAENLLLGREPRRMGLLDRRRMQQEAQQVLARLGMQLSPSQACGRLSIGEQQMVEIAKGIATDAKVFIFDEPTAPLNRAEVDKLEAVMAELKARGKLIFYISHRLDEIFRNCDTVTVLKDGRFVLTEPIGALTPDRLVTSMVGRPLQALYPPRRRTPVGSPALAAHRIQTGPDAAVSSFELRRGEIVGIGGLEGQGQREIVRALAGVGQLSGGDLRRTAGDGSVSTMAPDEGAVKAVARGVGLIPEDRKLEGLYLTLPIASNLWLGALRGRALFARAAPDERAIAALGQRLQLRAQDLRLAVGTLSGGNQQKVMVGRWFAAGVDTLLVEQPTRGIDVGAKAEIYALLREFAEAGGAVLALSSDLHELIGLCDRVLIVRDRAVVADVRAEAATEENLLGHALVGTPMQAGAEVPA